MQHRFSFLLAKLILALVGEGMTSGDDIDMDTQSSNSPHSDLYRCTAKVVAALSHDNSIHAEQATGLIRMLLYLCDPTRPPPGVDTVAKVVEVVRSCGNFRWPLERERFLNALAGCGGEEPLLRHPRVVTEVLTAGQMGAGIFLDDMLCIHCDEITSSYRHDNADL